MLPDSEKRDQDEVVSFDDSFFWRPHTITALVVFVISIAYFALFETSTDDLTGNVKRGLFFACVSFIYIAMTHTKNGPFTRPHPILWRFVLACTVLYELFLIFLLFQTADDARMILKMVFPDLGVPLVEQDYGGSCDIYDPETPDDPFHNFWDKMDWFVIFHLTGWWAKSLLFRDYWMSNVLSITFEVLEYSLEHQLPNFAECWWDHWILDVLVCNGLGIILGHYTLEVLEGKTYYWRDLWSIPGHRGKLKRVVSQFTPHHWTKYDWGYTEDVKRWFGVIMICGAIMLYELNTFYLKAVLWIPPPHAANYGRSAIVLFMGAVAVRESYEYMSNPKCKRFGQQSWMAVAILITECLVTYKFGYEIVTKPFPTHVIVFWVAFITIMLSWSFYNFTVVVPRRKRTDSGRMISECVDEQTLTDSEDEVVENDGSSKKVN